LCGELNGHVLGVQALGFEEVHGGYGFRNRNLERKMPLEFAETMTLIVTNMWFQKGDRQKFTYETGDNRTVFEHVLVRRCDRVAVSDVKVIRSEVCILQHKLMVYVLDC
jgi:hypothetical protein